HSEISAGSARVLETLKLPFAEPIQVEEIKPNPCDVAIVGMGCLLAGAQDRATFWRNIIEKVDAIREIPSNRFDSDRYFDDDARARDKIYSKWGGFLDDIPFDPFRYGIPPSALTS